VTGPKDLGAQVVENLVQSLGTEALIEVLGPIQSDQRDAALATASWRYLIRYEYSVGEALAKELKSRVLRINAGNKSVNARSGRASRAVRLRMDDSEVI